MTRALARCWHLSTSCLPRQTFRLLPWDASYLDLKIGDCHLRPAMMEWSRRQTSNYSPKLSNNCMVQVKYKLHTSSTHVASGLASDSVLPCLMVNSTAAPHLIKLVAIHLSLALYIKQIVDRRSASGGFT